MYRQRGRPLGHWWRLAGVQLYSAWAGLAVDVYSVQRVYTGLRRHGGDSLAPVTLVRAGGEERGPE